jgi:hypothetical protein
MMPALALSSGSPADWVGTFLVALLCLFPIIIFIRFLIDTTPTSSPGNRTEPRPPLSYGADWYDIRRKALERDGYRCANCGAASGLEVHHIVPKGRGGSNQLGNLKTLCEDCHKKTESYKRPWL